MATTNKYFKVKNGLDVNSNATVDASGNANIAGNLTANTGFISADTFRLDTTYTGGSAVVGEFSWDPDNETARLLLDGVNLQIGQEHVIRVKNHSGSVAIPDRTLVMFAGATGDTVTVSPADSSNVLSIASDYVVGITTEEIPADGFGFVTQFGFINNVNTAAWTVGTLLYADPANAGDFVTSVPSSPGWKKPIAAVTKQSANAGRILVRALPGVNIKNLEGTQLTTPTENDILRINSGGIVVNSNLSSANIANLASASTQTFTGNVSAANFSTAGIVSGGELTSTNSSGLEGGQINLAKPATSNIAGNVIIDIYNDKLRFFDGSGTNRGAFIDLTAAGTGVGTNLLSGGSADGNSYPTSFSWTDGTTAGPTGNLAGTDMTTVAYSAIPSASGTVSGVVNTTTQTFAGDKTFSGNVTAATLETTNNGNGTNLKVGDDAWIGDINIANTIRVKGLQNSNDGYIVFGDSDAKSLGRSGTGPLTFDGNNVLTTTSTLDSSKLSGTVPAGVAATSASYVGYIGMPQQAVSSGGRNLLAADAGKHIYMTGAAQTITIPANSNVAYETGTTIVIVNGSANVMTVSITTDTLTQALTGTTGSRSIAAYGMATLVKVASTNWFISGAGVY